MSSQLTKTKVDEVSSTGVAFPAQLDAKLCCADCADCAEGVALAALPAVVVSRLGPRDTFLKDLDEQPRRGTSVAAMAIIH